MEDFTSLEHQCSKCSTPMKVEQKFCVSCGYPENGTRQEKASFVAKAVLERSKAREAPKKIKSARTILFVISGLAFLYGIIIFFTNEDSAALISSGILSLIYLGLGFWSQEKPLVALVLGLLVYLTITVLNGILEPTTVYKGIILKLFIIVYLSKGINSALVLRNSYQS